MKEKIINAIGIGVFLFIMIAGIILIDYRIAQTQPQTIEVVENG